MPSPMPTQERMPSELIAALAMVQRACGANSPTGGVISVPCMALHVAASVGIAHNLLPALAGLHTELSQRTPDASQHLGQLRQAEAAIKAALPGADPKSRLDEHLAKALSQADPPASAATWLHLHGALTLAAQALMNIATALRPQNPSRHEETQCDALTMVCAHVLANDLAMTMAATTADQPEGREFQPLLAHNLLESIRLLTDATTAFTECFVCGISLNRERISDGLASSLMLVTAPPLEEP